MHVGVLTFRVRPGKMEKAVLFYLGSVVPKMREQRGFRDGLVLSDPEVDEGCTIALWETEEDAEAYESSGAYREQAAKLGDTLANHPPERSTRSASRCRISRGEGVAADDLGSYLCSHPSVEEVRPVGRSLQSYDLVLRADETALDDFGADAATPSPQSARHAGLGEVLDVLAGGTGPIVL